MKRLRAKVRRVTGNTAHWLGLPKSEGLEVQKLPAPREVEISEEEGAFFLYRLDEASCCIADTWHQTEEEAKSQANFEFDIKEDDWRRVENGSSWRPLSVSQSHPDQIRAGEPDDAEYQHPELLGIDVAAHALADQHAAIDRDHRYRRPG